MAQHTGDVHTFPTFEEVCSTVSGNNNTEQRWRRRQVIRTMLRAASLHGDPAIELTIDGRRVISLGSIGAKPLTRGAT